MTSLYASLARGHIDGVEVDDPMPVYTVITVCAVYVKKSHVEPRGVVFASGPVLGTGS